MFLYSALLSPFLAIAYLSLTISRCERTGITSPFLPPIPGAKNGRPTVFGSPPLSLSLSPSPTFQHSLRIGRPKVRFLSLLIVFRLRARQRLSPCLEHVVYFRSLLNFADSEALQHAIAFVSSIYALLTFVFRSFSVVFISRTFFRPPQVFRRQRMNI